MNSQKELPEKLNIYFLVEGKTEKKIYSQWISHLLPELKRVYSFDDADDHNYYLFNCGGYPQILNDIPKAAEDIRHCGKYSYLVVCLDADESTVEERKKEVIEKLKPGEMNAQLVVIVQNRCFETWFLGNRNVYSRNPQDEFLRVYNNFYNVSRKDPESMPNFKGFNKIQQFHKDYLKRMLAERGISYTKANPRGVGESRYVKELKKRISDMPGQLETLHNFFTFCGSIRRIIN
jgi:hypothetical protein